MRWPRRMISTVARVTRTSSWARACWHTAPSCSGRLYRRGIRRRPTPPPIRRIRSGIPAARARSAGPTRRRRNDRGGPQAARRPRRGRPEQPASDLVWGNPACEASCALSMPPWRSATPSATCSGARTAPPHLPRVGQSASKYFSSKASARRCQVLPLSELLPRLVKPPTVDNSQAKN